MQPKDTFKHSAPCVLITRPEGQQLAFAKGCRDLGFSVSLLPCLKIIPCANDPRLLSTLLASQGTVLFTSANAVRLAHNIRPFPWPDLQVHAIGAATAQALKQHQQPLSLTPQAPFNSESYLEQISDALPGRLLIVKGRGGRKLIPQTLEAHGWHVSSLDVYERVKPDISDSDIHALFADRTPDVISATSDEVLTNLWQLCRNHTETLKDIPLVLNSQRCAQLAIDLGFRSSMLVAVPAGDKGQLIRLAHWKNTVFDTT